MYGLTKAVRACTTGSDFGKNSRRDHGNEPVRGPETPGPRIPGPRIPQREGMHLAVLVGFCDPFSSQISLSSGRTMLACRDRVLRERGRFDHQSWAAPGSSVKRRCCRGWPKRSLNRIEPFQSAVSFRTLKTKTFIPRFNSTSATVSWSTT